MRLKLCYFILLFCCLCSCTTLQKPFYFGNIQNKEFADEAISPIIQKNDLLSITVSSLNPEATIIFNLPNQPVVSTSNGNVSTLQTTGYLVDVDGEILFPILGKVKAEGFIPKQLSAHISELLSAKKLLVDPIVNVRLINFKVTVLGEVGRPGVVSVANEKISMMEAIGMAGDMTLYAQRDNVLLVRTENGKKITQRLNLNSQDFLQSPYYYLKTNDIVYVEPNNTKIASTTRSQQLLPVIFSALSFLTIVIAYLLPKR